MEVTRNITGKQLYVQLGDQEIRIPKQHAQTFVDRVGMDAQDRILLTRGEMVYVPNKFWNVAREYEG